MTTKEIIGKIENLKVLVTWEHIDGDTGKKEMTLGERLLDTCEQGELVSGAWLKENVTETWNDGEKILPGNIYCFSTEDIYDLGNTYEDAKRELSEGYVSQLSNTQWFEGEDYWETKFLD